MNLLRVFRKDVFDLDEWEEEIHALVALPGAVGNIMLSAVKQVKPLDLLILAANVAGLILFFEVHKYRILFLLPTLTWLMLGTVGGVVYLTGGVSWKIMRYWEPYPLLIFFALFGFISFRLAFMNDNRIYYPEKDV